MLNEFSKEEVEKVTCYYKLKQILPSEKEYITKCPICDGFPVKDGCIRYTTEEHIKRFPEKYGLDNINNVPTGLDDIDQQFPPKTLDDIGSWHGRCGFGD